MRFDKELIDLLNHHKFVVLDIETTGYHPEKGAKIIEIGALKIENGQFIEDFSTLIDPELKISKKITDVTGITNQMVKGKPVYEEVLPHLYEFIGDAVIVCHNATFDWDRFLLHYFKTLSLFPTNPKLDTMHLFKKTFPDQKSRKLDQMSLACGVELEGHHRAVNDALATAKCFLVMREKLMAQCPNQPLLSVETPKSASDTFYPTNQTVLISANYWEKEVNRNQTYRRLYVTLRESNIYGKLYYDYNTNRWYNVDFPCNLNFNKLERFVLIHKNVTTINDLRLSV